MRDWLIIGGGPHGIHIANCLLDKGVSPDKAIILDPNAKPLAQWKHHTENTGMTHLRSPEVHNLDVNPLALGPHATTDAFITAKREQVERGSPCKSDFIPPYSRPSLQLFMHHVESIVEKRGLMRLWKSARAESIGTIENGYRVETDLGEQIESKNVILALGMGDQPKWPEWATQLKAQISRVKVHHIFAQDFEREQINKNHDVAIVGAGISAAQLALCLLEANPNRQITIVSRHFLSKEDFDSDPGWLGPTLLTEFHAVRDYSRRRAMIKEARNKGTLASEVMDDLQNAILHKKVISFELAEIDSVSCEAGGQRLRLRIRPFELDESQYQENGVIENKPSEQTQILEADAIVLATGFEAKRPGGAFIDEAIQKMGLPTSGDGFPTVDRYLRWRKGLFVMGPLAELEVGPASRNISGARMAAERIVGSTELEESLCSTQRPSDTRSGMRVAVSSGVGAST